MIISLQSLGSHPHPKFRIISIVHIIFTTPFQDMHERRTTRAE